MDVGSDSDYDRGTPVTKVSLMNYSSSSDDLSEFKVNPAGIIPIWETDSESAASFATDTDADEGEEGVEENVDQVHRPIKRRRSFNRNNERNKPIKEKEFSQMTPREKKRSACTYVHPTSCCKRKQCHLSISDQTIRELRIRVFSDPDMDLARRRTEIRRLWDELLQVGGKPCCVSFICHAFGVSKMYLYGDSRLDRTKIRVAAKTEAAIAFFDQLRLENDKMPNKQEYQLYAPKRNSVWEWYCNQAGEVIPISRQFFLKLWREYAPDLKLRKYLKFSICKQCKHLKEVRLTPVYTVLRVGVIISLYVARLHVHTW